MVVKEFIALLLKEHIDIWPKRKLTVPTEKSSKDMSRQLTKENHKLP